MKKSILLFALLFNSIITFAQLSQVYYEIEFNEATNLFDCKMYVESGSAVDVADRLQLNAKYSIVAETGVSIAIEESYFPLLDNEDNMGTIPMQWSIGDVIIDAAEFPGYDIFAIVPDLSQPAHYNDILNSGDITLFSLSADGPDICALSLRVFENDDDPIDLPDNDFTNTMMIGTDNEIYFGNFTESSFFTYLDVTINEGTVCSGECITLTPTFNCIYPGMTYEWSTGETTESITVCPEESDEYILFLSGPIEFSSEVTTFIEVDGGINTNGVTVLCVGEQVNYLPESGLWTSSDETVVSVTNEGVLTPLSSGVSVISHTTLAGNCEQELFVTVLDPAIPELIGSGEICVGDNAQLLPNSGVTWTSGNPGVATVDDSGLITGVSLGITVFSYTTNEGQCTSEQSPAISVLQIPEPIITGLDTICVGAMTTLTPTAGIEWSSSDISIATIDNNGNVTAVAEGTATFSFTDIATGCTSDESEPVTVRPTPTVQLSADSVCQFTVVDAFTESQGGTWMTTVISGDPLAASIDNNGNIETDGPGVVSVQYISEEGCISDESVLLTIFPEPTPDVTSNSPICIGENLVITTLTPAGVNYSFEWIAMNGFSSNEANIIIPNADLDDAGTYVLVASEYGCESDEYLIEVVVEDCDPCSDDSIDEGWIKVAASTENFPSIRDFEIKGSLVSGRDLEDFVYYNNDQQDVRLIKNNGDGLFEEEVILFDLPLIGSIVILDIADIDQDGLNEIITYQYEAQSGTNDGDTVTISIFHNLDDYSFEKSLSVIEDTGLGYINPVQYVDLDNQGFLDIVPYFGAVYFTENWEENSIELPESFVTLLIEDLDEDGLLDILGNENQFLVNNGDRTFAETLIDGDQIYYFGVYDKSTGVYTNSNLSFQITTGSNPSVTFCKDIGLTASEFFYANVNSSSIESRVINTSNGFFLFDTPFTCETNFFENTIFGFVPTGDSKIDINKNGFTDFITVEDGEIFVWINPNDQPKVRGTAFIDNNGDGMLNENDSPLRNVLISIEPGSLSVLTDDNGNYQFAVPEGQYTLTANVNEGEWILDELTIENFDVIEPCNLGFDFGFEPDPNPIPSVNLSMVNTNPRCDFEVKFTITVENAGTEPLESQLQFEFDDKTSFFSTEIVDASVIGNKVTADIGPLTPFQPQKYEVVIKMPNGSSVLPMLDFKATLVDDAGEVIAEYGYAEQLRCSYDPNDKREFPDRVGDDNLTLMDEDIEYTIRFQNNGNDTAYNVTIFDALDSNIDPSTIRVVSSSHEVETCIEETTLIFLFEDIYLVDSMTNYPGSQGYVTFKCNAKDGRAEFTTVNNTADIVFDTNLPIVTNQTTNTLVSQLCIDKATTLDMYICDGEEYLGYTESGTYTESYGLLFGCDSIVTINLTVQGITYSQQSIDVCGEGTDILLGSETYYIDSSTVILDTLINDQGCISNILKYDITVIPDLIFTESVEFCVNETGSSLADQGGLWMVDDGNIISIDEQGNITAMNAGTTTIHYLDAESGCTDLVQVEVFASPIVNNEGSDQICINETNILSSEANGTWISSDPDIATITVGGLVTGKESGEVSFTFVDSNSGCTNNIEMTILLASDSNCIVSTKDIASESVNLYPNPAKESIFIESKSEWISIRLINAQGQVLMNEVGGYMIKKQIDLREVASGLYFIALESESGVVVKKFIVD